MVNWNENIKNLATMLSAVQKWDESAKEEVANILEDLSKEVFGVSIKSVLQEKEDQQNDLIEAEWNDSSTDWEYNNKQKQTSRDVIPWIEAAIAKMM